MDQTVKARKDKSYETNEFTSIIFCGSVSSGKSSVINSLMGEDLLPYGDGATTCNAVYIRGTDEDNWYFQCQSLKGENRCSDKDKLTEMITMKLDRKNKLKLFYPRRKCPLLEPLVQFIDTPGSNSNNSAFSHVLKTNSATNLIFVLVANSIMEIPQIDQDFIEDFKQERFIVLWNWWDLCASEQNRKMFIKTFEHDHEFCPPMNFISAKEHLTLLQKGSGIEDDYLEYLEKKKLNPSGLTEQELVDHAFLSNKKQEKEEREKEFDNFRDHLHQFLQESTASSESKTPRIQYKLRNIVRYQIPCDLKERFEPIEWKKRTPSLKQLTKWC